MGRLKRFVDLHNAEDYTPHITLELTRPLTAWYTLSKALVASLTSLVVERMGARVYLKGLEAGEEANGVGKPLQLVVSQE